MSILTFSSYIALQKQNVRFLINFVRDEHNNSYRGKAAPLPLTSCMEKAEEPDFDLQGLIETPGRLISAYLNNFMADLGCATTEEFHQKLSDITNHPYRYIFHDDTLADGINTSKILESISILRLEAVRSPELFKNIATMHGLSLNDPELLRSEIEAIKTTQTRVTKYDFHLSNSAIIHIGTGKKRVLTDKQYGLLACLNTKKHKPRTFLRSHSGYQDEGLRGFIKEFNAWVRDECGIPIRAIEGDKKIGGYKFATCIRVKKVGRHET